MYPHHLGKMSDSKWGHQLFVLPLIPLGQHWQEMIVDLHHDTGNCFLHPINFDWHPTKVLKPHSPMDVNIQKWHIYLPMDIGIRKWQFCLWILTSGSVSFAYGYWHPEMSVFPTDIGIQKCQLCLRTLASRSVNFAYGHWHPELALFDYGHF